MAHSEGAAGMMGLVKVMVGLGVHTVMPVLEYSLGLPSAIQRASSALRSMSLAALAAPTFWT